MKNKYISACICIICVALCTQSCYDDKGNYTYHEINELKIGGLEKTYTFRVGETITIIPEILSSIDNKEGDYSYEWVCLNVKIKNKFYTQYVCSKEKEWINHSFGLPSDTYTMYYRVLDKETGVKWCSDNFTLIIENDIAQGFFILSDINNVGRLDFINYNSVKVLDQRLDILTAIGTELPSLNKPLGVVCFTDNNSPYLGASGSGGEPTASRYMAAILTEEGAYRLHPSDFRYEERYHLYNNIFLPDYMPPGFYIKEIWHRIAGSSDGLMMDNNNDLYYYYSAGQKYWTFRLHCNVTLAGQKITVSPLCTLTGSTSGIVAYDIIRKSFVYQTGSNNQYLSYYNPSSEKDFDGITFKYNETGMDLVYVHSRPVVALTGGGNKLNLNYAILEHPDTKACYYAYFEFAGTQLSYFRMVDRNGSELPEWRNRKEIAMTCNASNQNLGNDFLYYRTDENIYQYNTTDRTYTHVYTAPAGEIISKMSFIKFGDFVDRLAICTYNPGLPAESCGRLEIWQIENKTYGGLFLKEHNGEPMSWTGFGKIIDLDWKSK